MLNADCWLLIAECWLPRAATPPGPDSVGASEERKTDTYVAPPACFLCLLSPLDTSRVLFVAPMCLLLSPFHFALTLSQSQSHSRTWLEERLSAWTPERLIAWPVLPFNPRARALSLSLSPRIKLPTPSRDSGQTIFSSRVSGTDQRKFPLYHHSIIFYLKNKSWIMKE